MRRKSITESVGIWGQLVAREHAQSYPRGSLIYAPGQPSEHVLLLSSGQVGLYLRSAEGRTLTLRVVEAGQLFGEVAIADGEPYDTFAEALTPICLYRIERDSVRQLIDQHPSLAVALLEDLGQHRLAVSRQLDEVAFKSVPARLASLLLDMAR